MNSPPAPFPIWVPLNPADVRHGGCQFEITPHGYRSELPRQCQHQGTRELGGHLLCTRHNNRTWKDHHEWIRALIEAEREAFLLFDPGEPTPEWAMYDPCPQQELRGLLFDDYDDHGNGQGIEGTDNIKLWP